MAVDPEYGGAVVGQELAAEGAGGEAGEFDYAEAGERWGLGTHCWRIVRRCLGSVGVYISTI